MNDFTNPSPVEDWLKVHRQLIAEETNFTDLAIKAASGSVSAEELTAARERLVAMREICSLAYAQAFPNASPRAR
jgi:hypothetical protein